MSYRMKSQQEIKNIHSDTKIIPGSRSRKLKCEEREREREWRGRERERETENIPLTAFCCATL